MASDFCIFSTWVPDVRGGTSVQKGQKLVIQLHGMCSIHTYVAGGSPTPNSPCHQRPVNFVCDKPNNEVI